MTDAVRAPDGVGLIIGDELAGRCRRAGQRPERPDSNEGERRRTRDRRAMEIAAPSCLCLHSHQRGRVDLRRYPGASKIRSTRSIGGPKTYGTLRFRGARIPGSLESNSCKRYSLTRRAGLSPPSRRRRRTTPRAGPSRRSPATSTGPQDDPVVCRLFTLRVG
jgi:hypothetical protein